MRPRTLQGLELVFLTALLGVVVVVGYAIYVATHDALNREVDVRLAAVAVEILPDGQTLPPVAIVNRIALLERQRETRDIGFMLLDPGRSVAGTIAIAQPSRGFSGVDRARRIPGLTHGRALVLLATKDLTLTLVAESKCDDQPPDGLMTQSWTLSALLALPNSGHSFIGSRSPRNGAGMAILRHTRRTSAPCRTAGLASIGHSASTDRECKTTEIGPSAKCRI